MVNDRALVAEHRPDLGAERLGDRLGSRGQRQPGRHRVLRPLPVERLHRYCHLQRRGRRLRGLPADGVDVEHDGSDGTGSFSWLVSYDSTNHAQRDIPASCHETSDVTITNGGTISSP